MFIPMIFVCLTLYFRIILYYKTLKSHVYHMALKVDYSKVFLLDKKYTRE